MNEPRYAEDVFKTIWLWIGIGFIAGGFLSFVGESKPGAPSMVHEANTNGVVMLGLGTALLITQAVLRVIASQKKKLHDELLANGTKVNGTVKKVCQQNTVRYGGKYPYIIFYTYNYQGKAYHGESCLLWDKPDIKEHDPIVVYTNGSGKSTVILGASGPGAGN